MLIRAPRTPPIVRIASLIVALAVGGVIVWLVFTFGYYASGLAALKEHQRRQRETPIPATFADPNAPPAARPPDPNSPIPYNSPDPNV